MRKLIALLLFPLGCFAQSGSPYSNNVFPAQSFTATAQTGAVIQLNGQQVSYGAGTISLTGTSLTTATIGVQGSSDNGVTYYALPISAVASPGSTPTTTVTATASGLYQVSLVGITHVKFVTSGTFTATSVSLVLTATPNFAISRNSGGGTPSGVASLPGTPNVVYTFTDQVGTSINDTSGNSNSATFGGTSPVWTGTGLDFCNPSGNSCLANGASVNLPSAVTQNLTWCAAVYIPPYTGTFNVYNGNALLGSSITNGVQWFLQPIGGGFSSVFDQASYNAAIGGNVSGLQEAGFHTLCYILGLAGQPSTKDRVFTDGIENANSPGGNGLGHVQTTGTLVLGNSGSASFGLGSSNLVFYYFAGWSSQLTAKQVLQASRAITSVVATRGVPVMPTNTLYVGNVIEGAGDSIMAGFNASFSWMTLLSGTKYGAIVNNGVSGITAHTTMEQGRWRDTQYCSSSFVKTLSVFDAGTNDMWIVGPYTPAQVMAWIAGWVGYMQAAGCQVAVGTMISHITNDTTAKDVLNPLIRSNAAALGYFVVDFASDPNLGCDNCSSGGTYFNGDHIHPTNAGQTLMGAAATNAINAYGYGSASSGNPTQYTGTVSLVSADRFVTGTPVAAATYTLPDCLGVTGAVYQIYNNSAGANTITMAGLASEAISGSATIAQNATGRVQATLISQAAGGCGWQRVQ